MLENNKVKKMTKLEVTTLGRCLAHVAFPKAHYKRLKFTALAEMKLVWSGAK